MKGRKIVTFDAAEAVDLFVARYILNHPEVEAVRVQWANGHVEVLRRPQGVQSVKAA